MDDLPVHETLSLNIRHGQAVVEKRDLSYVLRVPGFSSPREASDALKCISVSLLRLTVEKEIDIQFEPNAVPLDTSQGDNRQLRESAAEQNWQQWKVRADGTFTDSGMSPYNTTIVPEHQRVWEYPFGQGHEIKMLDLDSLATSLDTALSINDADGVLNNRKLLLAIRTLGAANNTFQYMLRFVLLVTALEILRPYADRPAYSQKVITSLLRHLQRFKPSTAEKEELAQLRQDITNLKKRSISAELRDLARSTMPQAAQQGISPNVAKAMSEIYDIRSKIVHEGSPSPKGPKTGRVRMMDALEKLRVISSAILLAKLAD
jgi:hypothetical protein